MIEKKSAWERPWQPQHLSVPREDESLLALPYWGECLAAARDNRQKLSTSSANIQGRTLSQLREWSCRTLIQTAREYTAELSGCEENASGCEENAEVESGQDGPIFVAGHQPSLFHPGVWVKNFAIHRLAKQTNGLSVNLVVDNDTLSACSVPVPCGNRDRPRIERIPFDRERLPQPWEEADVQDAALFESFCERVESSLSVWPLTPILREFWSDVVVRYRQAANLRDCFTAGRIALERRWNAGNLELPISRLCTGDPFLWFASHLFAHAGEFREIHNQALSEYRRVNRVRSRTHPVPELTQRDGWTESSFWVWRAGDHRRSRVLARQVEKKVLLAFDSEKEAVKDVFAELPLSPQMDGCCAVDVLRELPQQGIRLRTRALTTTLFARLCLGDFFVHGIGGSKYDEMTDHIIARFFQIEAPRFQTLSATLHMPLAAAHDVAPADLTRLLRSERDFRYNADRYLTPGQRDSGDSLLQEKSRLIAAQLIATQQSARSSSRSRRERRAKSRENSERFQQLQTIATKLAKLARPQRDRLQKEIEQTRAALAANQILLNREYPFCIHPEEKLRPLMTTLATP